MEGFAVSGAPCDSDRVSCSISQQAASTSMTGLPCPATTRQQIPSAWGAMIDRVMTL